VARLFRIDNLTRCFFAKPSLLLVMSYIEVSFTPVTLQYKFYDTDYHHYHHLARSVYFDVPMSAVQAC